MDSRNMIAIGRLARHTGTKVETVRYYERLGLWPAPGRSAGGYRRYGHEYLKRLHFIRRARSLGCSLAEVRTLRRLADERKRPCAEARVVANIDRLDVYLGDRPLQSLAVGSRSATIRLPSRPAGTRELRLFGFDRGKLAVATRIPIS